MDDYRIIYPNEQGGVSIIVPVQGVTQQQALEAVPQGSPYLVVSINDIPTDRTFRDAWQADFTDAPIKG